MERFQITVSEDNKEYITARLGEGKYDSFDAYMEDLIQKDRADRAPSRLEDLLQEGFDSGEGIPVTPKLWNDMISELALDDVEEEE